MMDNLSTSDDVCKDDLSENNDADSNCSDVLATENKNKQSRKKSLNDMLKKLNPRGDDSITTQGLPAFLQKNSNSLPLEMTCSNDPELPCAQESSTSAESKLAQDSKSGGSAAVPTQARVSSPKSTAEVYKCYVDACSLAFSQVSDFKQHINSMHQDVSSIPCCFCYSTYKRENIFDHLALHIKNVMKCIYCQVSQDTREELLKHLSDKHPNQPKKINVCIRILNNVRSKRPNSEQSSEQKPVQKISPSIDMLSPGEASSNSTSEVPKSRKTRKSAKPLKTQVSSATDEIEIQTFDKELPVNCDQCTFSCNSDKLLKQHLQEGHISPCGKASLFACKQCKTATDCKDAFSAHLSHHKGSHTLRCYLCPYCTTSSNSMDTIEDHVGEKHPSEVFRFEVLQEKIDYLQNMLTCPICNGGYIWQKPFISHLESVHQIKDVVDYLLKNYNEKSLPDKAKVPRSYFRNLLPDAPDYDMEHNHLGEGDPSNDENFQTLDGDEPRVTSILEAHLVGSGSQEDSYSGMYAEGVEFSERFPPADLSQYVIKKGTPTTFSCDMCPFECVKTAHFRRHLEVHRRNESLTEGYRCGYCQFMHNRLNCIRFHLGKYHRDEPYKMTRIVDNSIISYGPEDDPTLGRSKAKKPFLTASTPNNEKEKRLPIKFEPSSPTTEDDLQAILQFEKQLPTAMIYQDPIKCPKCDFRNRVRINLIRHLKLHKEDRMPNGSSADRSVSGQVDREMEKKAEEEEEKAKRSKPIPNPLLEFLTSAKGSSCDGDFLDDAEEVTFVSRTDLTDEYKYFSIKLPSGNQYQCKECKFIHRYPSKVKRHYYYKHAPAFPFKCGYCSFGAVESGKVKRHCKLIHKHKREMVIKRNVYKKENQSLSAQSICKVDLKKEKVVIKQEVNAEDGVKITHEVITSREPDSSGDLWLPQFVTMLDDDMQCCKLCGYQQEGTSSLRDHVFYAHLEFYPFSCTHCGFALMDTFRVKKHIDMHHAGMPYVAVKRQIKDDSADQSIGEMVVDEMCSQMSSNFDESVKKEPDDEDDEESRDHSSARSPLEDSDINSGIIKRQFKCHYCGVISKWNRRDIRLHILHVHLRKKVYTCRHCGFGNSKSKAIVRAHCIKFHPSKNVSVRDELVLFNAIIPIDDSNGIVTMALSNKDGTPIFELPNEEEQDKTSTNLPPVKVESKVTRLSSSLNSSVASPSKSSTSYLKSDKWKCKECTYASNSEIDVKYHLIASHMNLKPYSCPHCHLYMNKVDSVSAHIDRVHPGKHKNVVNTVEEKAGYLQKNMECLFSTYDNSQTLNEDEDVIDADFARVMEQQTNPRYSSGYFRCLICGYRDPRNDKTKYHIIKNHLNLRQFSCPHCNIYMWGRQQVIIHIEEAHPGKEVFVKRTFQEYDEFLRKSIKRFPYPRSVAPSQSADSAVKITTKAIPRIYCDSCSFVTDSELSLAAHKRTHKIFQCFYCEFKHMLAARVQSHCLTRHPYKLVRFKQINSSNFESTKADSSDVCEGHSEESEVEFEKDDEDRDEIPKGNKSRDKENGTYICRHCQVFKFSKSEITKHLDEVHPGNTPAYTFIKAKMGESVKKAGDLSENGMDDEDMDGEAMEIDGLVGELPIKMNNVQNTKFSNLTSQLCKSRASLYQCRLCTYKSNKMTVMRHHIMSHLRYHPYICPYCDVARSVKSFPIKKHVMAKHPGKEVRSLHCVNEEIEKKIANSYFKLKLSNLADESFVESHENNVKEDVEEEEEEEDDMEEADMDDEDSDPPQSPVETAPQNHFKCKFCSYETSFKTDMKHHLMKEINYKPLKCSNCAYAETQRPALSKHYQMKHPGCEVKVKEEINGEKEELVRKMLEETYVKKEPQEAATGMPQSPRPIIHNTRFSASRKSSQSPTTSQTQVTPQPKQLDPIPLKSNPKMLKCPKCSYTNSSMKLVRGHMIKHGPYRFKCSYCDYHAHYPSRIRKHTKTQHQGLTFKFTKVTDFSGLPSDIKAEGPAHAGSIHSDSSNAVYLDGVPMDLPFKAHSDGWFRCQYCDYKSLDRDNFKVHLVTHKPPRWKCFHCNQRYPVVFRVRRHCLTKHPRLPVKWMDVETGRVYSNSKSSAHQISTALLMLTSAGSNRRGTARKSAGDDRLLNEVQTSRSVERFGKIMRFSCHICDFSEFSNTTSSLLKHLKVEHFWSDKLPSIEILPTGDEGEVWALRRCGFCAFETYNSDTFRCHVLEHTIRPPVQCTFCSFASFSRSIVVAHAREEHSEEVKLLQSLEKQEGQKSDFPEDVEMKDMESAEEALAKPDDDGSPVSDKLLYKELQEGYIMSAQNESERPLQWCGNFEGYVRLVNVMPKGVDSLKHD